MTAPAHRYGCHGHAPHAAAYRLTGGALQVNVFADGLAMNEPHRKPCPFSLSARGQVDAACTGCGWKGTPP